MACAICWIKSSVASQRASSGLADSDARSARRKMSIWPSGGNWTVVAAWSIGASVAVRTAAAGAGRTRSRAHHQAPAAPAISPTPAMSTMGRRRLDDTRPVSAISAACNGKSRSSLMGVTRAAGGGQAR